MGMQQSLVSLDPIQPFFVNCTANTYYKRTVAGLPVAHFYSFAADANRHETIAVPDGSVDILFVMGRTGAKGHVYGPVTSWKPFPIEGGATYFGVRYHPGAIPHKIGVDGMELTDHAMSLANLPGGGLLLDRIASAKGFAERTDIFLSSSAVGALGCRLGWEDASDSRLLAVALSYIVGHNGGVRMKDLEQETGYTARSINYVFLRHMGVSPKAYCKHIRFQTLIKLINRHGRRAISSAAAGAGYFDHSHMLKDFRAFTSYSPKQYLDVINLPAYAKKIVDSRWQAG
ncbi:MAG: helix-turn-helix domain-containing protein [Clostridiales bacterium]|jgi:AraC-like DNA-binding protein|nr:helix-turn-helix domain-containing protein [Clostridiales bacterium]